MQIFDSSIPEATVDDHYLLMYPSEKSLMEEEIIKGMFDFRPAMLINGKLYFHEIFQDIRVVGLENYKLYKSNPDNFIKEMDKNEQ